MSPCSRKRPKGNKPKCKKKAKRHNYFYTQGGAGRSGKSSAAYKSKNKQGASKREPGPVTFGQIKDHQ